jgi:predicted RNA polymerase sigma factor
MAESHSFDAVRAGLLEELARWDEALEAYRDASSKTTNASEIRYFEGKIEEIQINLTARVGKERGPSSSC